MEQDEKYLLLILQPLCQDKVKVVRTMDELGVLLMVHVTKPDMGMIIGKKGATANAIRTVMAAFGGLNRERINVKIAEPELYDDVQ